MISARDRQVAIETVRPRSECPHCNPKGNGMSSDQELSLLTMREGQVAFDDDQKKALIDVLRVKRATDADLAVFFHMCRAHRPRPVPPGRST
jgi:hypothetical protein